LKARSELPPGSRLPQIVQGIGLWSRPLAFPERLRRRFGTPFTVNFPGAPPFVIFDDPDEIKEIFLAPPDVLHPGEGAKVLEPVVGLNSVILLDEDPHLEQRKLLLPAMHGEKMAALTGLIEEVTTAEIASWPRDVTTELHSRFQRLTLEVILRAVFGLDEGPRLDNLRDRLGAQLAFGDKAISLIPPPPESRFRTFLESHGPFAPFVRLREDADALVYELIEERRADGQGRDDILSMLLEARHEDGSPMSDEEMRDELMTMLLAGHETTASTLAWAFDALSRHPHVVERLREELESGDGDDYLTAVIHETMRRRPVLPNTEPRFVMKPFEVGGRTYPPGVALIANAYLLHHHPAVYPEPYAFRPERFLEEPPGTYTFIPFGGGRRRCIGASFAMVEMKIVLRAVLSECEVEPVGARPEPPRRRNITIKPGRGARVVLRRRVREPAAQPAVAAA
jgi:cytochrome P450